MKGKNETLIKFAANELGVSTEDITNMLLFVSQDKLSLKDKMHLSNLGIPTVSIYLHKELVEYLLLLGENHIVRIKNSPSYDLYRALKGFRRAVSKEIKLRTDDRTCESISD